jgi:hypothetical protein
MKHRPTRTAVFVVATLGLTMGAIVIGAGSANAVASNWRCTSITSSYPPNTVYGTNCQGSGGGTGWVHPGAGGRDRVPVHQLHRRRGVPSLSLCSLLRRHRQRLRRSYLEPGEHRRLFRAERAGWPVTIGAAPCQRPSGKGSGAIVVIGPVAEQDALAVAGRSLARPYICRLIIFKVT